MIASTRPGASSAASAVTACVWCLTRHEQHREVPDADVAAQRALVLRAAHHLRRACPAGARSRDAVSGSAFTTAVTSGELACTLIDSQADCRMIRVSAAQPVGSSASAARVSSATAWNVSRKTARISASRSAKRR